jgi:hypothetical protein
VDTPLLQTKNSEKRPMKNILGWFAHTLLVTGGAALLAACGDSPAGPDRQAATPVPSLARNADLGACGNLNVPAGSTLAFRAYAKGVQIYRWTGNSWTFVAPEAGLYADAGFRGEIGIHYAGPTWESVSGSKVVGAVIDRCTTDPNAIPWLKLGAVSATGPGIFHRVAFILRVNTVGGTAPATAGTVVGEQARVPYTAEYFFYRAA